MTQPANCRVITSLSKQTVACIATILSKKTVASVLYYQNNLLYFGEITKANCCLTPIYYQSIQASYSVTTKANGCVNPDIATAHCRITDIPCISKANCRVAAK